MSAERSGQAGAGPLEDAAAGVRTIFPVMVAVVPFALVLGALAAKKGLTPVEVALMSGLVFAGSAQFAAIELWTTPAAVGALAVTAFLINLRHVLMGVALAPHLRAFTPGLAPAALFLMADEIWALALRRSIERPLTAAFYFGMGVIFWANWVAFTVAGALAGALIDDPIAYGFDFAFVAIFIVLLKSFWTGRRSIAVWAASALAALTLWRLVEGPWYVLAGALAGMATAWAMAPADPEPAS